jgi:aspartyl-tRNA synthetase
MFYALPQSPQLFKQILMVAGFDKYYQIVRCFRDEDLRADRQPEFTQVDLEMSFTDEEGVMNIFEGMMKALFKEIMGKDIPIPMPRLEYREAMDRFGTDKPDMRFGMELREITDLVTDSDFMVFKNTIEDGGVVKAVRVEKGANFTRKILDELSQSVNKWGAKGLSWVKITDDGWQSSVSKFVGDKEKEAINKRMGALTGDLILIISDRPEVANRVLGMLRQDVARRLDMINKDEYAFVWVTRFPLLEYNETEGRLDAVHHPFTSPLEEDVHLLKDDPEKVRARSYDLVLNGIEIGGGSIRIHNISLQERIFNILGISKEETDRRFGFFLEALRYGAPPHGGMALGFDRLVAVMSGVDSLRDIIAFPKTTSATCLLTDAPARVDNAQLKELAIQLLSD